MSIRVKTSSGAKTVRVGQRNAVKVVASQKAATTALGSLQEMSNIQNVDDSARANNTLLMYQASTNTYIHIPCSLALDLADTRDDEAIDYGSF